MAGGGAMGSAQQGGGMFGGQSGGQPSPTGATQSSMQSAQSLPIGGGARTYFQQNPDVAQSYQQNPYGMNPMQFANTHYQNFGQAENRMSPSQQFYQPVYKPQYQSASPIAGSAVNYFQQNPDVARAYQQNSYGMNPDQFAQTHYQNFGQSEQRGAPVSMGVSQYGQQQMQPYQQQQFNPYMSQMQGRFGQQGGIPQMRSPFMQPGMGQQGGWGVPFNQAAGSMGQFGQSLPPQQGMGQGQLRPMTQNISPPQGQSQGLAGLMAPK